MGERDWDPNEWQAHCTELLTIHYGVRVQIFPDRVNGDGGLEAYVADEGIAFQCYAPESPFGVADQTAKQREKIRSDTKKLVDKPKQTQELIGEANQIREWVLLTPVFEDKALVAYAGTRSVKVRLEAAEHSWCSPDFRISIHDETLFAVARAKLLGAQSNLVLPVSSPVDVSVMRASGEIERTLDDTLRMKFGADQSVAVRPQLLAQYTDETLGDYFRGKIEMARLLREAGSVHQSVVECAEFVFSGLASSIAESDDRPLIVVKAIREQLTALIASRLPHLGSDLCARLARFYVASWWIECPLQFEVANV
ncbi:hypothetical protein ACFVAJ_11110 [Agromyces sp. NPDC057679]|uniref:hypothetical protein n=1 Tax=Agromyces sp. NPDC057679 TaxID=3346207 RepID=UPI00366A6545